MLLSSRYILQKRGAYPSALGDVLERSKIHEVEQGEDARRLNRVNDLAGDLFSTCRNREPIVNESDLHERKVGIVKDYWTERTKLTQLAAEDA